MTEHSIGEGPVDPPAAGRGRRVGSKNYPLGLRRRAALKRRRAWKGTAALLAAAVLAVSAARPAQAKEPSSQNGERRIAMILMDSPNLPWSASRLLTAMVFAGQLQRMGVKAQLVFYSFAVPWLSILEELPSGKETEAARRRAAKGTAGFYQEYIGKEVLLKRYRSLRGGGVPVAMCPGSAEKTGLTTELASKNVPLVKVQSDEKGEMNIAPLVLEGYQVWVF